MFKSINKKLNHEHVYGIDKEFLRGINSWYLEKGLSRECNICGKVVEEHVSFIRI
jgi:hypothetical protein